MDVETVCMTPPIRLAPAFLVIALSGPALATDKPSPIPGTPDLAVASVKAESGVRVSKLVGAAVYNKQNQELGTIDDLILDQGNKVTLAVVSVGGFLGVGSKLVAEPYSALRKGSDGRLLLSDATKASLNAMPSFTYNP